MNIVSSNYIHKTLVALIARGAEPKKAAEKLCIDDEISTDTLDDLVGKIQFNGPTFLTEFFKVKGNELEGIIDNLVSDYGDIIENPIVAIPENSKSIIKGQAGPLVMQAMDLKELDEPLAIKTLVNRVMNRINHSIQQPIASDEIMMLSRAIKELSEIKTSDSEEESLMKELNHED